MKLKEKLDIKEAKLPNLSFVKNPSEKLAIQRLKVIELAEKLKNVSEACRRGGMDRTSFYEWKRRYQIHGLEGLVDQPPVPKSHPSETPQHVKSAILELSLKNPAWGSKRIETELGRQGLKVSNFTVQRVLKRAGMGTRLERFLMLEEELLQGVELPVEQVRALERANPCLKERRVESGAPGELVSFDSFYVGVFKGVGRCT
jgi:transposase